MNNVASAVSRILNQHTAHSWKGKLLWSPYVVTSAALLLGTSSPALADCPAQTSGTSCSLIENGAAGTPAPAPGGTGGAGGPSYSWNLELGTYVINFVDAWPDYPLNTPVSPLDIETYGGVGAQGADGHLTGGGSTTGGTGGAGGAAGDITTVVGAGVSGTVSIYPVPALQLISIGGAGGEGAFGAINSGPGVGGLGGNGGDITADLSGNFPNNLNNQSRAVNILSGGGAGGGGRYWSAGQSSQAPGGGNGGNAGQINLTLNGTFVGNQGGVSVVSQGGAGGYGGLAEDVDGAQDGDGGTGGNGNNVLVTVGSNSHIETFLNQDGGLIARSAGGTGGNGEPPGSSGGGSGGNGGTGGNAGNVTVTLNGGTIASYAASGSPAILAQSLGGNGGNGGKPSEFVIGPEGGAGAAGGTTGSVSVVTAPQGGVTTIVSGETNNDPDPTIFNLAPGILAQSIGGGGGSGGNSKGVFAVGGDGGNAVNGNTATVDVLANITTYGINSDGIAVQSIGGGGGKGGDAVGTGVLVNMVIGGLGGAGGDGSTASVSSQAGSVIETNGAHGEGILVQSIGGGGGMGGAAYSKTDSAGFGSSMSLGGDGGTGGQGGQVLLFDNAPTNAGRITTTGSDSYGILAQSIGGGGGMGGASTAAAQVYGGGDVPSIALSMAMGGSGGAAGSASTVQVENTGLITTTGAGSVGILGQSVGGGGGAGGDASSASTASKGDYGLSASFSFGGAGGNAGNGGNITTANSGFILTTGESAAGILAQSIGGGGGNGGSGDAKASSTSGTSLALTATVGGTATNGGDGYLAAVTNTGSILTLGDGSFGAAAQSIGGGGGNGGGGAGSTNGTYSASLSIGGSGGGGGSTYHTDGNGNVLAAASVTNGAGATIVTFGADANGIIAQSIAGGGGAGGKAATSLGSGKSTGDGGNGNSTGTSATLGSLATSFDASGLGGLAQYAGLNGAIQATSSLLNPPASGVSAVADDDPESLLDEEAQSKGDTEDDNQSKSIHLQVGVGGSGGNGGAAGSAVVTNNGEVATMGNDADAILAQAIGGGGGKGGAASTATTDSNSYSGSLAVGGTGGDGGYGGMVTVTNTGTVYTMGALAAGIVGESISGGGGVGGASASSISSSSKSSGNADADDGAFQAMTVSVGGNGGGGLNSGQVRITSSGAISTAAHDSIGIVAQSISGGGGIVKTIATDLEGAGGSASAKETNYDIQFKFGGSGASTTGSGYGSGLVDVTTQAGGTITTKGDNSYGILAQSIAGGGGVALGGTPAGSTVDDFFGKGAKTGSVLNDGVNNPVNPSGNSGLFVTAGDNITTSGAGAIGIVAQSIGGGGGLAGNTGASSNLVGFSGGSSQFSGNGGYVDVTVNEGATVSTSGRNAPALFLQSIGGGGGRVTTANGAYIGTAGGKGTGGTINATINGTVQATGQGSAGILAQSQGDSTSNSPISITVGSTGKVIVGQADVPTSGYGESAGIYINHGGVDSSHPNVVTNNGQILTYGSVTNSVAVYSSAGYTQVYNNAGATMAGDVLLTNDGGSGCFTNASGATFYAGDQVTVGTCGVTNAGTINVGSAAAAAAKAAGAGGFGTTTITGDYIQKAGGTLNIDADLQAGKADALVVTGKAAIAGTVNVNAITVSNKPVTVLTASGGVSVDSNLRNTDNSALFDFPVVASGNQLTIQPTAHLSSAASTLDPTQKAVAGYMQQLFDSGASFDDGFTALSKLAGGSDYSKALQSMTGDVLGAFGAFRVNSSRAFAYNLYQGCRELTSDFNTTDSCTWARASGGSADQTTRGDTVGYRANAYTVDFGSQVGLSDRLALVGSLGYESNNFSGDDTTSSIQGNAALAGLGINFVDGHLELSGAVDGAYGWYRSSRTITVGAENDQADANPRQWQVGLHLRGGYEVPMGSVSYVKPFVDGNVIRVSNDGFTEGGPSLFRLTVDGRTDTAVVGGAGVEFGLHIPTQWGAEIHPFVSAAAEFGQDVQWTTTAHFAGQSDATNFVVRTAGPGTIGKFGIGADIIGAKNLSFSVMYEPEVGDGYRYQGGTARLSYRF